MKRIRVCPQLVAGTFRAVATAMVKIIPLSSEASAQDQTALAATVSAAFVSRTIVPDRGAHTGGAAALHLYAYRLAVSVSRNQILPLPV
jgi:hypothetical protein